ncbi:ead/Ea22-like family protein [Klebsiella oxytoca]|nr:ead/Ea22-like family protein [Klebsiella oxytoca]HEM7496427.1 ead/Ea22-like family protein [Klebsiella oxytoca]HEM7561282.1 ead/Ea22-like family protein [Klebsiella oxytoca]
MTDITELAQSLKAAAENATPGEWCSDDQYGVVADAGLNGNYYIASCSGPEHRSNKRFIALANPANILALVEALDKLEKTSEARREAIDRTHNMFVCERDRANAAEEALEKAQTINAAAEKLVRCKGRYHSELNYRALADLFGVTMPDLPPLDGECRTVTVKLPQAVSAGGQGYQAQVERILTAAGIKVEAE